MAEIITEEMVWDALPVRKADTHKAIYGRVLVVAGSTRYRGAAALTTEGLLRGGAGLVTLATVKGASSAVLSRTPEAMVLRCQLDHEGGIAVSEAPRLAGELAHCDALLMGPGLGDTASTAALVNTLVRASHCPVVLDADALNVCARMPNPPKSEGPMVLTPHPGEMARICHCTTEEVQANREQAALDCAAREHCIVVLKGSETLIAGPDGTCWMNRTGNPGLAKGGSGDILAGLLTAFVAQGIDPMKAAIAAVHLHGAAADACARRLGQYAMLPHDIFQDLGQLMAKHGR